MPASATFATWNVRWAVPGSARGDRVEGLLARLDADVLCVTEAQLGVLPSEGAVIQSEADYGYPNPGGKRHKVILWSRSGWDDVDFVGDASLPSGRFAMGTTSTALGSVRVIGVCVPWRDAHVRTGRRDRTPWEEHSTYLSALEGVLAAVDDGLPTVLLGDLNQRVPRTRQPREVADRLSRVLGDLQLVTRGPIPGVESRLIDHIAISDGLLAEEVTAWLRRDADGQPLSDHDGVQVRLVRGQRSGRGTAPRDWAPASVRRPRSVDHEALARDVLAGLFGRRAAASRAPHAFEISTAMGVASSATGSTSD